MSSSTPTSGSGSKPTGSTHKPVYKLITFEDLTPYPTAAQKQKSMRSGQPLEFKSWRTHQPTETWMDKALVEREIKEWPGTAGAGYIKNLLSMGKSRREILDNHLKALNETDKSPDMVGMWEPEYLWPGEPVIDKETDKKLRSPALFWVIVKRQKKVPEPVKSASSGSSSSSSSGSSNAPKGVLKDDKKPSSSKESKDSDPLVRELLDAVTRLNTKDNGLDIQAQLQQVFFALTKLLQKQDYQVPMAVPMPMPNQYPQMQPFPFQTDQKLPAYSRLSLPPPPYNQYLPSPEDPQARMNPNMQNMQSNMQLQNMQQQHQQNMFPHNPHHDNSNRSRQANDGYSFNSHLNSNESPNYPRDGAGSRRNSTISLHSHFMGGQDEMMSKRQFEGGRGGMLEQDMQSRGLPMIANHPNNQRPRNRSRGGGGRQGGHMVDSWQHDGSSSSGGSDEEYRPGRSDNREDSNSIYNPGHLRNSRQRSSSRGDIDLSGNRSRRGSVAFSDRSMMSTHGHGRMVSMNKGYGDEDSGSEDEMNDQRMMMRGMSINRMDTMTPAPWPHHNRP
ncbi:hypothetical protein TWF481_001084 [Arthrobotrys musiformis]|uniref:Uncharacterized protein n=1 Tax=Arthrobotrys musiformis TaxID=47236 RepID=A0AAV9WPG8_9PEZI